MFMPQILDLLGRLVLETVVALARVAQPVLAPVPEDAEGRQAEDDDLHDQVDGVADGIGGGVVDEVGPAGWGLTLVLFLVSWEG